MGDMPDMAAQHQVWLPRLRARMLAARHTLPVCAAAAAAVAEACVAQWARDAVVAASRWADNPIATTPAWAHVKSARSTDVVSASELSLKRRKGNEYPRL